MTAATRKWKDVFDAAKHGNFEAVRAFVEKDDDLLSLTNNRGRSIALIAASRNDSTILKYVLEKNNTLLLLSDYTGYNIMQHVIDNNDLDTVKYLIEHHSWDVHHINVPSLGNTPIHHAAKRRKLEILKYFIEEKKGDVNVRNYLGDTPVFLAAAKSYMNIVRYLVEQHKADLTLTNTHNENILFGAAKAGHLNVLQYVLEERKIALDINWTDTAHRTILYLAVKSRQGRIIKYLIEAKHADVNIADDKWVTPLHLAADYDSYDTCKYLIEHGANLKAKDKEGYLPVDNADNDTVVKYFREVIREPSHRSVRSLLWLVPDEVEYPPAGRLTAIDNSADRMTTVASGNKKASSILDETNVVSGGKFDGFLTVANAIFRFVKGSSAYRAPERDALGSPREILETRMDPIAVEAVFILPNE